MNKNYDDDEVFWKGKKNVSVEGTRRTITFILYKSSNAPFKIVISDDEDPCFLAHLVITRNDYEELKKLQALLVDYDSFPMRFVKLIEQCVDRGAMYLSLQHPLPTQVTLEIIEHNEFRKLIHLSLKLCLASDVDLKKHMAAQIIFLKRSISELSTDLGRKDSQLKDSEKAIDDKMKAMNDTLRILEENIQRLKIEHQETLKREHEKYENEKYDWEKTYEMNVKTQTMSLQEAVNRKDKQLEDASLRYKQMQDALKSLESQIIDKNQKILVMEQQMHTTRQDAEIWRNQNGVLGKDFHEKDLTLQQTKNRLSDLEKILKEKSDLLRETLDSLQVVKKEKLQLETKLHQNEISLSENKQALKETTDQLLKANQIISKLNSDMLESKDKLLCRTAIALEQEKVIERYSEEKNKMELKEKDIIKELNELKSVFETLKKEHDAMKTSIAEKDDIIKNNNSVIQWLHKKLDTSCEPHTSSKNSDSVYNSTAFMSARSKSSENDNVILSCYNMNMNRKSEPARLHPKLGLRDDDSSENTEYTVDPAYLRPMSSHSTRNKGILNGPKKGNNIRAKVDSNYPSSKSTEEMKEKPLRVRNR